MTANICTRMCSPVPQHHRRPACSMALPEGEWSVAMLSMVPSASPPSSRARFSPSRRGGAHLNLLSGVAPGQQPQGLQAAEAGGLAREPVHPGTLPASTALPACLPACLPVCWRIRVASQAPQ